MAGIPHHAADGYIARLVQAGQKIAICEQLEAPGKGKKLLRRDVVRVITPGTLTDTAYLGGRRQQLPAGRRPRRRARPAWRSLDVSTGEFWAGEDGRGRGRRAGGGAAAAPRRDPAAGVAARGRRRSLARLQATGAALTLLRSADLRRPARRGGPLRATSV